LVRADHLLIVVQILGVIEQGPQCRQEDLDRIEQEVSRPALEEKDERGRTNLLHPTLIDGRRVAVHGEEIAEALLESGIVRSFGRDIKSNELTQNLQNVRVRRSQRTPLRLMCTNRKGERRRTFSSASMPDSMSFAAPSTAMASTSSPSKEKKSEIRFGRVKLESAFVPKIKGQRFALDRINLGGDGRRSLPLH
jgi:hypothetical protein